jgi:RNA polymerase sigma-70 factor (ECF subfamily)
LDEPLSDEEGSEAQVDALADPSFVSALEKMEEEERRVQLRAAIASLSMPLREVVLLRIEGELSFQEIADLLGLKLGTVLARMHHAVRKIKLEVEKVGR